MASNQAILLLFLGEIWKSLSAATPPNASLNRRDVCSSTGSPGQDKAALHQLLATGPSSHKPQRALAVTTAAQLPEAEAEASDGSWIAALLIGIILVSMLVAVVIILLWKCRKRPAPVDANWAGRSPFADGDTPDSFMDSEQATKRSSVLFLLPWRLKQDTNFQGDPTASEKAAPCPTSNASSQLPPPAEGCPAASSPAPSTDPPPAPTSEAASTAPDSCPAPDALVGPPELPPPPDWLRESTEVHSSELSKHQEPRWEAEEELPPPPQLQVQEIQEPLPRPEALL
ncbi:protein EVI2B [Dryobates pubescens]|uniref:protein EVI2B n=1 Tax=Dryobates pubescens TaxID=118200 RepID=UPI0023B8E080|nr:protein EVI2B [Dryobates pubescens]